MYVQTGRASSVPEPEYKPRRSRSQNLATGDIQGETP